MGLSIVATVFAASLSMRALSLLGRLFTQGAPAIVLQSILLSVAAGVFAGVATVTVRAIRRKTGRVNESLVSALFTKGLEAPQLDGVFWARVLIGATVGMFVGVVAGAMGCLNIPQLLSGASHEILTNPVFPIYESVLRITGGAGGGGEFDWIALVGIAIALILAGLILGVASGLATHIIMASVAGLVKGTAKAFIIDVLIQKDRGLGNVGDTMVFEGFLSGLLVGFVTGVLMAVSTAWGIVQFF